MTRGHVDPFYTKLVLNLTISYGCCDERNVHALSGYVCFIIRHIRYYNDEDKDDVRSGAAMVMYGSVACSCWFSYGY